MGMSDFYAGRDDQESLATINRALESGITISTVSIQTHRLRKRSARWRGWSIAWILAQGEDIVPIPGTKRRKYLEENVGALECD
jgi:aryl-alcohol dehydrogenase-like predicted oxidoreductase